MHKFKSGIYNSNITIAIILTLIISVLSYAGYQRLISHFQNQSSAYESKLNIFNNNIESRLNTLEKATATILPDSGMSQVLKKLNDQRLIITKLVKHNRQLDSELKLLHRHFSAIELNTNIYDYGRLSEGRGVSNFEIQTIAELEEQDKQSEQAAIEMLTKIDNDFMHLNQEIQLSKFDSTKVTQIISQFNNKTHEQIQAESIDCRESMCKIKIKNIKNFELFESEFRMGLSYSLEAYNMTQNIEANSDGSISSLYYLWVN